MNIIQIIKCSHFKQSAKNQKRVNQGYTHMISGFLTTSIILVRDVYTVLRPGFHPVLPMSTDQK